MNASKRPGGPAAAEPAGHAVRTSAPRRTRRTLLVCLLACLLLPTSMLAGGRDEEGPQRAFLELHVNGTPAGDVLVVVLAGEIWIDVAAFEGTRLPPDAGRRQRLDGRECVSLSSLAPDVTGAIDAEALALRLTLVPALLGHHVVRVDARRPPGIEYRRSASAFVNYAAAWDATVRGSLALESGVTIGRALLTTQLTTDRLRGTRRGATAITLDARSRLQRWTIGDAIGATGTLGGALPLAGVGLSRAYELDPYFVRHPTVGLSGALDAPGTVDVYVNDRLIRRETVPAGTIAFDDLPIPAGAGSARIVLRDAFGREQEIGGSYYLTTMLLASGLHQYQYVAGVERLTSTTRSRPYGQPLVMGTHRVGLSDALTVGARAEGSGRLVSGGPLAVMRLGRAGALEVSGALSREAGTIGHAWSLGYGYTAGAFSVGAAVRAADREYVTLSSRLDGRDRLARDAGVTVSTSLWAGASTSATWQRQRYHGGTPATDAVSVTNSVRLRRELNLFVTVGGVRTASRRDTTLFVGLTRAFGRRDTVGASFAHGAGGGAAGVEMQRSAPLGEGYGYRARVEAGQVDALDGDVRYQSRWGRFDVRQSQIDGQRASSVTAAGAIVAIGGRVHATRPVEGSFALVRVPGARNVRTYVSHQEIGRTGRGGDLLVPNLLPYYGNILSIADEDVPLAMTVRARQLTVAPPHRGGAVVVFPVSHEGRAMGRLVVVRGEAREVPAYGQLTVTGSGFVVESPIGTDGSFYLENVTPGTHAARVTSPGGTCEFQLAVPRSDEIVAEIGLVRCEVPTP